MESDLLAPEIRTALPGERATARWSTQTGDVDLQEASGRRPAGDERQVARRRAVASAEGVVDERAVAMVCGHEHAPTGPQRSLEAGTERHDRLGREPHDRAGVARTYLIVDGVEHGGHHLDAGVTKGREEALSTVGEIALEEQLARACLERSVLIEAGFVGPRLLLISEDGLGDQRVLGQLAEEDRSAGVAGHGRQRRKGGHSADAALSIGPDPYRERGVLRQLVEQVEEDRIAAAVEHDKVDGLVLRRCQWRSGARECGRRAPRWSGSCPVHSWFAGRCGSPWS